MKQEYKNYTEEDFEVWNILFERQKDNLQTKGSTQYLKNLQKMDKVLNADSVPNFEELNKVLKSSHGWQIEVVPGLIPVTEFFQLLSERKFCSSTWLRNKQQLLS